MEQRTKFRLAFFFEYYMGNVTFQKNLEESITTDRSIDISWFKLEHRISRLQQFIPIIGRNWSVRVALRGRRILDSEKAGFDGLFFHMQLPALLSIDRVKKVPTLISLDATPVNTDEIGFYYGHVHSDDLIHKISHKLNKRVFHAASILTPWSNWAKRSLVNDYQVPEEKIRVIPAGIGVNSWLPKDHKQTNGSPRLLFVGGDFERKGGRLLLDCFKTLARDDIHLDIITKDRVDPMPGVTVHANIDPNSTGLKDLFAAADVFVLPTFGDASPWVVLEAMASGLPVISTTVGAIPEMVENGKSGLLIAPKDGRELRMALESLLSNKPVRADMGIHGRQIVEKRFDATKNGKLMLGLLKAEIARFKHVELEENENLLDLPRIST